MARVSKAVEPEPTDKGKRKPDFLIKVRQPPERGDDGVLRESKQFVTIGAAWAQTDKHGKLFYGCKVNVPGMMMPDSFVLFPPFEDE